MKKIRLTCRTCERLFIAQYATVLNCPRCQAKRTRMQVRAMATVQRALLKGTLVRQPCEVCLDPKTDAHHDDYSRPLDVRWLCQYHHRHHHAKLNRLARRAHPTPLPEFPPVKKVVGAGEDVTGGQVAAVAEAIGCPEFTDGECDRYARGQTCFCFIAARNVVEIEQQRHAS